MNRIESEGPDSRLVKKIVEKVKKSCKDEIRLFSAMMTKKVRSKSGGLIETEQEIFNLIEKSMILGTSILLREGKIILKESN